MTTGREHIEWSIRYESSEGVHTYHQCDCGRGFCRREKCLECWREELSKLEKADAEKEKR